MYVEREGRERDVGILRRSVSKGGIRVLRMQ